MTLAAPDVTGSLAPAESRLSRLLSDLAGYGLVSVAALACDYGLLVGLVACGLHYLVASVLGFSVGMAVSYTLCIHLVFASRRAGSREVEAAGFLLVGVAGLALTQLLLYLFVARLGVAVALAKIPTTGLVFLFNFACRRGFVFGRANVRRPVAEGTP